MPNPHVEQAKKRLHNGTNNEVARAQAEATLALAHEQARTADALETANLIALYNMTEANCEGMSTAAPMTRENWDSVAKQIKTRLGLA
jgi:hypothetical protein